MVQLLQKRVSSNLELFVNLSNGDASKRSKSPSRNQRNNSRSLSRDNLRIPTSSRSTSRERVKKLVKRKSLTKKTTKNEDTQCQCTKMQTKTSLKQNNNTIASINNSNNKSINTKLVDAILDNDLILLRKLIIIDEYQVNEILHEGTTALHIASATGYLDCVLLLLECGANVNYKDDNSRTPLEYAVLYGNFDCASELIKYGANTNVIKDGIA